MTTVNLSSIQWSFNSQTKSILVSEGEIPFDTTYNVISPKTGLGKVFNFSHSTGPEFDPKTQWIYTTEGLEIPTLQCEQPSFFLRSEQLTITIRFDKPTFRIWEATDVSTGFGSRHILVEVAGYIELNPPFSTNVNIRSSGYRPVIFRFTNEICSYSRNHSLVEVGFLLLFKIGNS